MPELNKANRQVCDLDIRDLKTMAPYLFFETANTTTVGLEGDSVYAMAKGARRIAFPNPMTGTLSVEAQVYTFKFFSMFSDGTIDNTATVATHDTMTATTGGSLAFAPGAGNTIQSGFVFVYPKGEYGNEDAAIAGTFADNVFTATDAGQIVIGQDYEVGYLVVRNGVKKIAFSNKKLPKDYFITMSTLDKDEEGTFAPYIITAYKASIQRTWELSFSSEGDPATVTATFDLMEDKDGNILDIVEYSEDSMSTSYASLSIAKGTSSQDVKIYNASGAVTADVTDSSDAAYAKLHAYISGDNDTLIVAADSDAATGNYKVTLTDEDSQSVVVKVAVVAGE